jgi:hypothetical protein
MYCDQNSLTGVFKQMLAMIDDIAQTQRQLTPAQVWEHVLTLIKAKYPHAPTQGIRKHVATSRVHYVRHGSQKSDRLAEIEKPELALLSNNVKPSLIFNTTV